MSTEAVALLVAAFGVYRLSSDGCDAHFDEQLQVAEVRYSHALRRFKRDNPEFCGWGERLWVHVIDCAVRLAAAGHPIPEAEAAARRIGMDWARAVAACRGAQWRARNAVTEDQ